MTDVSDMQPDHEVAVVGGGFSGIGTAIKLDKAGIRDWVMLEAGDGVGGAWHWNTYPGIGVDIPSFSYQFSFEQRSDWSRVYAPGNELKAYAEHCMDEYGLRSRTRLNTAVGGATFDEENHFWRLEIAGRPGDHRALRGRSDRHLQPVRSRPTSPGSRASPARSCTRRAGTTTRTCAASAWRSSAPAPRLSRSSPRSRPKSSS